MSQRHGQRRGTTRAVVAAVVLLAGLAVPVAPAWATDPGAVPDASLDTLIAGQQRQLVGDATAGPVDAAASASSSADAALARATATLDRDRRAAAGAGAALVAATAEVASADAALAGARRLAGAAARATLESTTRLQAVGVGWYIGGPSVPPDATTAQTDAAAVGQTDLTIVTSTLTATLTSDRLRQTATAAAAMLAAAAAGDAAARRRRAATFRRDAAGIVAADAAAQSAAGAAATSDAAVLAERLAVQRAAVARVRGPEGPASTPTILGPPAVDAEELVTWFSAFGFVDTTATPIAELADWYIEEGDAEGVRGDLAFVQAVLETGGFASPDAVRRNNFAGIAHCDTCAAGVAIPSAHLGVQAQIQLLRTFATPGLTSTELAAPPVNAGLAPEAQTYVRGCCPTWNALTGVWATDPVYGASILGLYEQLLDFTLAEDPPTH